MIPLSRGIRLPRNSDQGESCFEDQRARLQFEVLPEGRHIRVNWPAFHDGRGVLADILLRQTSEHESMTIVIPIKKNRFYYNRKINCLPAEGSLKFGDIQESLSADTCLGSLDWGRGVWEYKSFWNWAGAHDLELGLGIGRAGRAHGGPEPGLRLRRYFGGDGELPGPEWKSA